MDRRLRPGGAYMMNLIDAGNRFARAEAATMRAVFRNVVVVPVSHNYVLIGSDRPVAQRGLRGAALDAFIGDAKVLTDDFAPVDQLLR